MSNISEFVDFDEDAPLTPVMPVGKHAGTPIDKLDRGYLGWMLSKYDSNHFDPGYLVDFMDRNIEALRECYDGAQTRAALTDSEDYQLSPSQAAASEGILAAIQQGETFIRLEGGAGYGKSFAVRDVVRNLLRTGDYYISATAVSYVATQVLKGQLDRYKIDCGTLARTLKMEKSYEGAKEVYNLSDESPDAVRQIFQSAGKRRILIIDEYSMINDEYAKFIGEAAQHYKGVVIVIGDLKQLPPVGQDTDTIFSSIPCAFELTDPMRYSRESNLYRVEQAVRKDATEGARNIKSAGTDVIVHRNSDELMDAFKTACLEHPHEDNRILFYQRQRVVDANNAVRDVLFGEDAEPLMPGERLMIVRTSDYREDRYYTGDTLDVAEVSDDGYVTLMDGKVIPIMFAVTENRADPRTPDGVLFNETVKKLTKAALKNEEEGLMSRNNAWKPLRDYKNCFVFVAYSYATTVHKSQGATVDRVFVSPRELVQIPKVGDNLTYVALTRAKKELHVC